jgi:hypothetical protein
MPAEFMGQTLAMITPEQREAWAIHVDMIVSDSHSHTRLEVELGGAVLELLEELNARTEPTGVRDRRLAILSVLAGIAGIAGIWALWFVLHLMWQL